MRIFFVLAVLIGSVGLFLYIKNNTPIPKKIADFQKTVTLPTRPPQSVHKKYLFVPYWSFTKSIDVGDDVSLIYFGVGVNSQGVEMNDMGYEKLEQFINVTSNASERILAIRMTDKNVNAQVLRNITAQKNIAAQAVSLAREHGFNGVLLDYETSAFAFDSTIQNISSFHKLVGQEAKKNNLLFYVALYGDTYHQARPFDVKQIASFSDKVIVMAYDFSKSRGNPGPNFPYSGREKYGYDFPKMVEDFQNEVGNEKLVIAFGYFGYDWRVDEKGESLSYGEPLSLNKINQDFVSECEFKSCRLVRDSSTQEASVRYIDDNNEAHVVWFEDELSAEKKKEFLSSKGINQTADWAYSYY